MVFNYSPNGRDVLSVIMCFPMTLLTNYEYQNTKHASSFFFLMNLTNLVGCLWQRQEVRVNLRKGNSDGARVLTSHDCGVPFLDLVLHVDLLCFWFISCSHDFFLQFYSLPFHHRTRHFKILPQRSNTAKIQVSYWLQLLHITNYQFRWKWSRF